MKLALPAGAALIGILIGSSIPLERQRETGRPLKPAEVTNHPAAASMPRIPDSHEMTEDMAAVYAASDPRQFFRWLIQADPQPAPGVVEAFFSAWIKVDCDAAFAAALSLPGRFRYNQQSSYFYFEMAKLFNRDPAAAFRWVGRVEGVITHGNFLGFETKPSEAYHHLIDPEELALNLNRYPNRSLLNMMLASYTRFLATSDLSAARRFLESLNIDHRKSAFRAFTAVWAESDSEEALKYLEAAPSALRQFGAAGLIAEAHTSKLEEGMDWLANTMGVTSYTGLGNLLQAYFVADPKAAQEYVIGLGDSRQRIDAINGLVEAYFLFHKTDSGVAWIRQLPQELRIEASDRAMRIRRLGDFNFASEPGEFTSFLAPLQDPGMRPDEAAEYSQLVASYIGGSRHHASVVAPQLAEIRTWLKDNGGPGRDALLAAIRQRSAVDQILREAQLGDPAE